MNFKSAKAFHEDYKSRLLKLGYQGVSVRPQTHEFHKKIITKGEGKAESFIYIEGNALVATFPISGFSTGNKKSIMAILHYLKSYSKFKNFAEIRLRGILAKGFWDVNPTLRHWDDEKICKISGFIETLGFKKENPELKDSDLILSSEVMLDSFDILETVYFYLTHKSLEDPTFIVSEGEKKHSRNDAFYSFYVEHLGLNIQFHVTTIKGKHFLVKNNDTAFEFTKESFSIQLNDLLNKEHNSNALKTLMNPPVDNLAKLLVKTSKSHLKGVIDVADVIMQQFIEIGFTFDEVEKESARILHENLKEDICHFDAPFKNGSFRFFGKYYLAFALENQSSIASMLIADNMNDIRTFYEEQFKKVLKEALVFN